MKRKQMNSPWTSQREGCAKQMPKPLSMQMRRPLLIGIRSDILPPPNVTPHHRRRYEEAQESCTNRGLYANDSSCRRFTFAQKKENHRYVCTLRSRFPFFAIHNLSERYHRQKGKGGEQWLVGKWKST